MKRKQSLKKTNKKSQRVMEIKMSLIISKFTLLEASLQRIFIEL